MATILVFTSSRLTDLDLDEAVVGLGGGLIAGGSVLDTDEAAMWPFVDNSLFDDDDPGLNATLEEVAQMLGGPLNTCVVLELSSNAGAYGLAGRFLDHLAAHHRCVVTEYACCIRSMPARDAVPILATDRGLGDVCPVHHPQ